MRVTANIATVGNTLYHDRGFERAWDEATDAARIGKRAALIAVAPFVGLAYVVALPVVGLGALAWLGLNACTARWKTAARALRNLVLFFAAPFVGLAYALALPFVGLGTLAWWGMRAAAKRRAAA